MQGPYLRRKCSGKAIKILQPQIHESEKWQQKHQILLQKRDTQQNPPDSSSQNTTKGKAKEN